MNSRVTNSSCRPEAAVRQSLLRGARQLWTRPVNMNVRALVLFVATCAAFTNLFAADRDGSEVHVENVPPFVSELAKQYLATTSPSETSTSALRLATQRYADIYLLGYISPPCPDCLPTADQGIFGSAYDAGVADRRQHPERWDAVMSGYGYRRVDVVGKMSLGYEKAAFVPDGQVGEIWWVGGPSSVPGEVATPDKIIANARNGGSRVNIIGYLSPKGQYGHLGAYDRQLLVASMKDSR